MSASQLPAIRPVYDAGAVERAEVDAVYLPSTLPTLADLEVIDRIAARAAASAYVAGARTPERAAMLILAGRELRVGPWQALSGIHIIKERPSISANLMGALVQRFIREQKGGLFRVTEHTDKRCTIEYRRPEWADSSTVTWTIEDAKRAGLLNPESTWHKFPRQMLFSRATGEAARAGFPDVVQGLYTPEELDDVPPVAATVVEMPATGSVAVESQTVNDTGDDPRTKALGAVHGLVADRYDGDQHDGLKALQARLFEDGDARQTASFTDEAVWTLDALRDLYRRIGPMTPAAVALILADAADPETGEIVGEPQRMTEREEYVAGFREIAEAAQSVDDWKLACEAAGDDPELWAILAECASTPATVDLIRSQCIVGKHHTPELESVFNAAAKRTRETIAAGTP